MFSVNQLFAHAPFIKTAVNLEKASLTPVADGVDALKRLKTGKGIALSSDFKAQPTADAEVSVFAPKG